MTLQKLISKVRKAIDDYNLIDDNDKIAIGVSGGKDSLALVYALHSIKTFYPKKFDLIVISVDLGFKNYDDSIIKNVCNELNLPYIFVNTEISEIVFNIRQESNPCSLCSKMRKGALNEEALKYGCNKIAYAHHMDDVIETLMMSMLYAGKIETFSPLTFLDKTQLTIIRPLIYLKEVEIKGFINKYNILTMPKICPADGNTKREYVKNLIRNINIDNPGVKNRMFSSVCNSNLDGWSKSNK